MTTFKDSRSELLETGVRLRHLHAEHTRAGVEGALRRKVEAEMRELTEHLERRLASLVDGVADRAAWLEHARHGGPAPEHPLEGEGAIEPPAAQPPSRPSGRRPWPR
jgi:hypothetical protein